MWRFDPRRGGAQAALWAMVVMALLGAGSTKKRREPPPPKVEETVTDLAYISVPSDLRLEGVGLVAGLDNTGADPPPSWYRDQLLDDMRKAGVEHANKLLGDPRFSLVIVKVRIPTGTTTEDRLDVDLEIAPAAGTKSLAGGYLLSCRLKEILVAGGTAKEGPELATAQGPVMIGSTAKPDDPKKGRILGGARIKKNMPFNLVIKENRRSFRTASLLQGVVNQRFPLTEGVNQTGVTKAKTDEYLVLTVPHVYHHNQLRYFRVVKLLPIVDNASLRTQRLSDWGKDLMDPEKAGIAALRLEGLGATGVDALKGGLTSSSEQVRFFAAEALAYVNDGSGADVLGKMAADPRFRAYALAALAAADQPAARTKLIKLMDEPDVELRYGAFNALRENDETDSFLGRVRVIDEPPDPEESSDSMSMAIEAASRRRAGQIEDPFTLYLVDCDGPPMIHMARTRRCEIVIFGQDQKLLTPAVLGNGSILVNASDGDEGVQISKIVSSRAPEGDTKVMSTLELGDMVRRMANLGAKYPDVVNIFQSAARQRNLPGPLVIDAVPGPSPAYTSAALFGKDITKKDDKLNKAGHEKSNSKGSFLGRMFGWGKK